MRDRDRPGIFPDGWEAARWAGVWLLLAVGLFWIAIAALLVLVF
jgi:hypothetical protein